MCYMKMLLGAYSGAYVGISIRASEGCSGSRLITALCHVVSLSLSHQGVNMGTQAGVTWDRGGVGVEG